MQQYILNYDVTWSNIMSLLLLYKLTDSIIAIAAVYLLLNVAIKTVAKWVKFN